MNPTIKVSFMNFGFGITLLSSCLCVMLLKKGKQLVKYCCATCMQHDIIYWPEDKRWLSCTHSFAVSLLFFSVWYTRLFAGLESLNNMKFVICWFWGLNVICTCSCVSSVSSSECELPRDEAGIIWDSICFSFLLLQRRVFMSYYFLHVVADIRAGQILASRYTVFENISFTVTLHVISTVRFNIRAEINDD